MTAFTESRAARVDERDYYDLMLSSVEDARRRVLASLFLFDIRPGRDVEGWVLELMTALVARQRVGVDVRVLISGHVRTPELAVANLASGLYLRAAGVPHRRIAEVDDTRRGSHGKLVVVDDLAVVGSQNWTDDGFRTNLEDAVLLTGGAVEVLAAGFESLWSRGKGLPQHAAE